MAVLLRTNLLKNLSDNRLLCAVFQIGSQKRGIYGKDMRASLDRPSRPKGFPWETKDFYWFYGPFDHPADRMDENSKVLVVEGPVGVGKTELAKKIAEEFDMRHFPEVNMDAHYINKYGYDLRQLDSQLPVAAQSYDHKNFCQDPNHLNAANYQILMMYHRYSQYIDALAHVLNTGQGVVLERSVYSDYVFAEAMHECKYMSTGALSVYYEIRSQTVPELLRPHLIIYLDIPVDTVKERIKQRDLPHERNSKALNDKYLSAMEKYYKRKYLKEANINSELLIYDWSGRGEVDIVLEDIERIDFDHYPPYDTKMKDWNFIKQQHANDLRVQYTNHKAAMLNVYNVARYDVPELILSAEDDYAKEVVYDNAPGMKYHYGYNKDMGDTGILFKWRRYSKLNKM